MLFAQEKNDEKGIVGVAPYAKFDDINLSGKFSVRLVEPEEVKPNFCTPSWVMIGAISVQVS